MALLRSQMQKSVLGPTIVQATGLAAGYSDHMTWHDANFEIKKGEFVAIIGPNGAGKTTLFRLLLGLMKPKGGDVTIFGEPPKRGNQRIGFVPQRHLVDTELNIEAIELVRLGFSGQKWGLGIFSNADTAAAWNSLRAVGGEELGHRSLGVLSGGELQRIFLAEALVSNPEVLLLDEPLSNLDFRREKELLELVNEVVRSRNVTALLIAHNINPVLPFLDKVIYIANGRVAVGAPNEVLTSESLSALYGIHIEVLRDSKGNIAIVSTEEGHLAHLV